MEACAVFLAWAMPRLGLSPPGFRRVRSQVCKRLRRRLKELHLLDFTDYRQHLALRPAEWDAVERCCCITISRFYRDRRVFDVLAGEIMPVLAAAARQRGQSQLRVWRAGCASGEEPYTVALIWRLAPACRDSGLTLSVIVTDLDEKVLARAMSALYAPSCLAELPREWVNAAFSAEDRLLRLRAEFRTPVVFLQQSIKSAAPDGSFDIVLCRNLAFTLSGSAFGAALRSSCWNGCRRMENTRAWVSQTTPVYSSAKRPSWLPFERQRSPSCWATPLVARLLRFTLPRRATISVASYC
jgi:chemotaxis protein methyltransferase CheR